MLYKVLALLALPLMACQKEAITPATGAPPTPPDVPEPVVCRIDESYVNTWTGVDSLAYEYGADGRLLWAEVSSGGQVAYDYLDDKITKSAYTYPEYTISFEGFYSYDARDRLVEVRYPRWYTSLRKGEYRLEVDSFFYDSADRISGMSTWAQVKNHIHDDYLPVLERSYQYDDGGNIDTIVALEYFSSPHLGYLKNTRVTSRQGFTAHRNLLFESPQRSRHLQAISPYLHEREVSQVTDPWGNPKERRESEFIFTPEFIIPEGYYTWSRPYICFY